MAKLGLALGSGVVRGFAHLAVLKALIRNGIRISYVSGSSAGAVVGAYFALHGEIDSLYRIIKGMTAKHWLKLVDLSNPKYSLIKGKHIRKFMVEKFFGDKQFRQTKLPLTLCAVNLKTHEPIYFSSGKIVDAVMASCSLPGTFPPYEIKGKLYVDGGLAEPVPTDILFREGMSKVIGVNINNFKYDKIPKRPTQVSILSNTFAIMLARLSHQTNSDSLFMIEPKFSVGFSDAFRFKSWRPYYLSGKHEIEKQLPALKKWL